MRFNSKTEGCRLDLFSANKDGEEGCMMVTEWSWGNIEGSMEFDLAEAGKIRDWLDDYLEARVRKMMIKDLNKLEAE